MSISTTATARIRIELDDRFTRESQRALAEHKTYFKEHLKKLDAITLDSQSFSMRKFSGDIANALSVASFTGLDGKKLLKILKNSLKKIADTAKAFKMPSLPPTVVNAMQGAKGFALKAGSALVLMGSSLVALPPTAIAAGLAAGAAYATSKMTDKGIGQLIEEAFQFDAEKIKERDRLNLEIYEKEQGITAQRMADIEKVSNKKKDELQIQSNITAEMDRAVTKTKEISDIQLSIQPIAISVLLENSDLVKEEALQLYSSLRSIFSTPLYQEVRIRPVLDASGRSSSGDIGQNPGGFFTSVSSRIGATRLARGADYIPYDDFPASLHRGEAVLPADVADRYRKGAVAGNITIDKFNVVISGDNKRPEDLARDLYFHLKRIGQRIEESVF
jgi:hypothetical protein